MRRATRALLLGLLGPGFLVLSCPDAGAQVNAEALRSNLRTHPRFLWIEGALAGRAGNTQTMTFGGAAFGGITDGPHLFFTRISADYGEARGATTVARWLAHARYNYRLTELVSIETLAQVQHDRFRRIGVRDLYGAGLRFNIINEESLEFFAGTTYLLEHEVIESIPTSPGSNELWNRSSSYVGLNTKVSWFVEASTVTYFQPRIDRPEDFRVLSESLVSFAITKLLTARISASIWYDHDPPASVRPYDVEVKNSLALKF
jgi:hypothetical protein